MPLRKVGECACAISWRFAAAVYNFETCVVLLVLYTLLQKCFASFSNSISTACYSLYLTIAMAPSLLCRYFTAVVAATAFSPLIQAVPYKLTQSYAGPTFFNNFDFITSDPTNGYVLYADQGTAQVQGYAKASADGVHLGVDHTTVLDPNGAGRRAVRIESKRTFTKGLFIGDFRHMPTGCGTWPAFWLYGPDWPYNGEIGKLY